MAEIRGLVFDFDGTLVNTFDHITQAFGAVLAERGIRHDDETIRSVLGFTLHECYEVLMPGHDAGALAQRHHELQTTPEMYELIVAYDGLMAAFEALPDKKFAIATNRTQPSLDLILEHVSLKDHFETIISPDHGVSKPDPAVLHKVAAELGVPVESLVMIGDTPTDILTGKAAGARTIGVTHGFSEVHELAEADRVIDGFHELPGAIRQLEAV